MILQALNEQYQRLLEDPDSGVAPPGYSPAKVSHAIVLDVNGNVVDVWQIAEKQGARSIPRILMVPEQVKRTSGISANILCDNASYVLGIERSKQDKIVVAKDKFNNFREKNLELLIDSPSNEQQALRKFLETWLPEQAMSHPILSPALEEIVSGSNLVFQLDGAPSFIHENTEIKKSWSNMLQENGSEERGQCLVTGAFEPIARVHPSIKGIVGAQTSGAAIVSYNADAFTSYGKSQSYNAPVSQKVAFAYSTALNYLIASKTNRVRLADTTMVFWAEKKGGQVEEKILAWCLDPVEPSEEETEEAPRRIDPVAARQAKTILERVRNGLPTGDQNFDTNTRCYLLGLAPNAARISVRFWQVSNFGELLQRIAQHYEDTRIAGLEHLGGIVSPWRGLKALAVQEDSKNIPPLLGGQLLKSILSGQLYPQTLFNLALNRCRTGGEHGGVNTIRASIIKGFLKRKYRLQGQKQEEEMVSVSLNEKNPNAAYQLGRLFSLLEKVQRDALGTQINATIRDRYFGAASATPGSVFPLLMRLSRHHISKSNYGSIMDKKIQDVVNQLDAFPAHLNLEEQGQFILGYYHQNQANYQKADSAENNSENK